MRWLSCLGVVIGALVWCTASAMARPFVYVTNVLSSDVSQYDVTAGGALSPLASTTVAGGNQPVGVASDRNGRNVYVSTAYPAPSVLQYAVGRDGTLALRSSAAVPADAVLGDLAVSPNKRSVYVINSAGNGSVLQYTVQRDGSLQPKTPASVPDSGVGPDALAVSPDGRSVYVVNSITGENTVAQYSAEQDGALTPKNPPTVLLGVNDPFAEASDIVVSPDASSAYVSIFEAVISQNGSIAQFSVGREGALTPKAPATAPADGHPTLLAVTPDGQNLYATDQPDGKVLEYTASRDGTLSSKMAAATAGRYPFGIVVSARCPRRLFLKRCRETVYVANSASNNVSQYSVGAAGVLSPLSPAAVPAGSNPLRIAVSPPPEERNR
jgi:6-phosphogluconolactonase